MNDLLAEVREAAAAEYEIHAELGRGPRGYPVYFARERSGGARLVLLELRPAGRDPDGAEQYTLEFAGEVHPPGSVAGWVCPSCGATDPRSGRFCARCGRPARSREELLEYVRAEGANAYEILGEMEHAAGAGVVYFARERASGELVALRFQQGDGPDGSDEYSFNVTRTLDPLLAGLVQEHGAGGTTVDRPPTIIRSHGHLPTQPPVPGDKARSWGRRGHRRRGARGQSDYTQPGSSGRPHGSHGGFWIAAAVLVLFVVGVAILAVTWLRKRNAPPPPSYALQPSREESAQAPTGVVSRDTVPARVDTVSTPVVQPVDSGVLRLDGVPRGAVASVDGAAINPLGARVPLGRHEVSIVAKGYKHLLDSVTVPGDTTLDLSRAMETLKVKAVFDPCRDPGEHYNTANECYDVAPKRVTGSPLPRVELPPDFSSIPRSSILWVRVSPSGRADSVEPYKPSSPAFEELARQRVDSMVWTPPLKNGKRVSGWLDVEIIPVPP